MSGELFAVWGQARFHPAGPRAAEEPAAQELQGAPDGGSPARARGVLVRSRDGQAFELGSGAARLSRVISDHVDRNEEEIGAGVLVPLAGRVVSKVVQYLAYHCTVPARELTMPLPSDNLVDCGVDRWDASFVSVQRRELFELMMAATVLQIPSLVVLTNARATLLMRGRDAQEVCAEFGLRHDMPADEEAELGERYRAALEGSGVPADAQSLHGVAGILAGLAAAAVENEVCEGDVYGGGSGAAPESLASYRHFCWHAAVLADWGLLATAPERVRGDRDLILAALGPSGGAAVQHASRELRGDRALFSRAVALDPATLREASAELRGDREYVGELAAIDGLALAYASEDLRGDRDFVLGLVRSGSSAAALGGAAEALLRDADFVLECLQQDARAYCHASEGLRQDRAFALAAAEVDGLSLQHMSREFRADPEVVQRAVAQNPGALLFTHASRRADLGAALPWDAGGPRLEAGVSRHSLLVRDKTLEAARESDKAAPVAEAPRQGGPLFRTLQKTVHFSAVNTMRANAGQTNYIAANSFLDKLPFYQRPTVESTTLMWGPVGGIGMRLKAFGTQDYLMASPENLMSIFDARRVLQVTCCRTDVPEWFNAQLMDPLARENFLRVTHGLTPGMEAQQAAALASELCPSPARPGAEAPGSLPPSSAANGRSVPLGGWPELAAAGSSGAQEPAVPPATSSGGRGSGGGPDAEAARTLREGARVRLRGLGGRMDGATGVALRHFEAEGKWRVLLDGGLGRALLREQFMEVTG